MSAPTFATAEGLRLLLLDLAYAGRRAWQTSPEAAELMTYTMEKYAGLAHKYGLEPSDAAVAAFEVMRMRSTRVAEDPWAVVTHAVELTLIYESRAEGLLCSTGQARKTAGLDYHDAERFATASPRSRTTTRRSTSTPRCPTRRREGGQREASRPTRSSPSTRPGFFVELGWPRTVRGSGWSTSPRGSIAAASHEIAYESLRRDGNGPGLLDVDQDAWLTCCGRCSATSTPTTSTQSRSRGILRRRCNGRASRATCSRTRPRPMPSRRPHPRSPPSQVRAMSDRGHIELERSVDSIVIGERHRQDPGDLTPLMDSMKRVGLLQPVTITPDGYLICGFRRLEAAKELGWNTLRVWVRSGISDELTRLLAERDENVTHKPLSDDRGGGPLQGDEGPPAGGRRPSQEGQPVRRQNAEPADQPGPARIGGAGSGPADARRRAAEMVTGKASYSRLEQILEMERIAADRELPGRAEGCRGRTGRDPQRRSGRPGLPAPESGQARRRPDGAGGDAEPSMNTDEASSDANEDRRRRSGRTVSDASMRRPTRSDRPARSS